MIDDKLNIFTLDDDEIEQDEVNLFALHSSEEIFKVVYYINLALELNLRRKEKDVDFVNQASISYYPLYHYADEKAFVDFYLVANKTKTNLSNAVKKGSLFPENSGYYTFLIPERKAVDYYFKINGMETANEVLTELKLIPLIKAVYREDIADLKSYKNLIFN